MAAILTAALSAALLARFGATVAREACPPLLVCRWDRDPTTGRFVCQWGPDDESSDEPVLLRLLRA